MTKDVPLQVSKRTNAHASGSRRCPLWPKGLAPFDFQLKSVEFASSRPKDLPHTYLALDPGLGKTIVARILLNRLARRQVLRCYFVTPPFLAANVKAEFDKWGTSKVELHVIADTALANEERVTELLWDICLSNERSILIVDEAHRFKNEKSKRSRGLFRLARPFRRIVFLSGTPLPNSRPIELWPIVSRYAPSLFGRNFFQFAKRYCGAHKTFFGWKFDGFSNKAEFKRRLFDSGFMLRLRKKDCINLPPKVESILTVGAKMPAVVSKLEREILKRYTVEDLVQGRIARREKKDALHLAEYLRLLGTYKLKYTIPVIEALLEETNECLILFAQHKDVIAKLQRHFRKYKPCVITGETPKRKRQKVVDLFQSKSGPRLFIGNIEACGIGFTLTRATQVIMVEFSWRDGDNVQATDRAHRIGQTRSVLVRYVVLAGSVDAKRLTVVLNKRHDAA